MPKMPKIQTESAERYLWVMPRSSMIPWKLEQSASWRRIRNFEWNFVKLHNFQVIVSEVDRFSLALGHLLSRIHIFPIVSLNRRVQDAVFLHWLDFSYILRIGLQSFKFLKWARPCVHEHCRKSTRYHMCTMSTDFVGFSLLVFCVKSLFSHLPNLQAICFACAVSCTHLLQFLANDVRVSEAQLQFC